MSRPQRQSRAHLASAISHAAVLTSAPDLPYPSDPRQASALLHIRPSHHPDGNDHDLAAYLESAWRKLHTRSRRPLRCPRCHAGGTRYDGVDGSGLPQFFCDHCQRRFNRVTDTPMARLKSPDKILAYFHLISQPISVAECARQLDIRHETVLNWSLQTRLWLLTLDPTGSWELRVRLGVRYAVVPGSAPERPIGPTQGCRCELVKGEGASRRDADNMPLLMRVCPLCERARSIANG